MRREAQTDGGDWGREGSSFFAGFSPPLGGRERGRGFFRKPLTSEDNSDKIVLALMNVSLYGGVAQLGERCVRNA